MMVHDMVTGDILHMWLVVLGRTCVEFGVLAAAVLLLSSLLRVPSPTVRHLFWMLVLLKPVVMLAYLAPIQTHSLAASGRALVDALVVTEDRAIWAAAAIWVTIAAALLGRLLVGLGVLMRLRRSAQVQSEGEVADALRKACLRIGLSRSVKVAVSSEIPSPILTGILRPMILFPKRLVPSLSRSQMEMMMLHELAHLRRFDNVTLLLQRLVQAFLFFHPATWLCSRMVKREAEQACDDLVVRATQSTVQYADSLVRVVEVAQQPTRSVPMTAFAATESDLSHRIRRLLSYRPGPVTWPSRLIAVVALLAIAVLGLPPAWAQDGAPSAAATPSSASGTPEGTAGSKQAMELALEEKAQSMLDGLIGAGRSMVRVSVELAPGPAYPGRSPDISRLSMALTLDAAKVVYDAQERGFVEATRSEEEVRTLTELAKAAVGFNSERDRDRDDVISVHAVHFDKTQQIQQREAASAHDRKALWASVAWVLAMALVVVLFSLWLRRRGDTGSIFLDDTPTRAAMAISIGLFLCLHTVGFWDQGLDVAAVGSIPGVFLLIVGASRLSGHFLPRASEI